MKNKNKNNPWSYPMWRWDEMIVVACGFIFINFDGMEMDALLRCDSNFND